MAQLEYSKSSKSVTCTLPLSRHCEGDLEGAPPTCKPFATAPVYAFDHQVQNHTFPPPTRINPLTFSELPMEEGFTTSRRFQASLQTPVCSQRFCLLFFCPLPPPPNQRNEGFPLESLLEGPQTELRTLSQNCEQTLQKLRTNRIMNKQAFLNCVLFGGRGRGYGVRIWW